MEVSRERPLTRWLLLLAAWVLIAALAGWHTQVMRDYIAGLAGLGRAGAEQSTPLTRPCPGSFSDSHTWVRYALAAQEGSPWPLRHTDTDNANQGREVHWSSAVVQAVAWAGRIQQRWSGETLPRATEQALAWINLPLLLACIIGFSAWVAARTGAAGGVLLAFGMIGHYSFYDGFYPNYVDHHGLLNAAGLGVALGGMLMGAGWWRKSGGRPQLLPDSPGSARRAAIVSGLCGAFGLWISAASTIPVIAIVGLTGLGSSLWLGRRVRAEGAEFDPAVWQWWGRAGAAGALVAYAIEYAPGHLSLRLEANHPFHAAAWWGAGELIARFADAARGRPADRTALFKLIAPVLALLAVPLTILLAGDRAFILRDPFVADLRHMVAEGMSFRAASQLNGWEYEQRYLINFVLVAAGIGVALFNRRDRIVSVYVTAVATCFLLLSCWEIRWWLTAGGPILCLVLALVATLGLKLGQGGRWALALGAGVILLPGGAIHGARAVQTLVRTHTADPLDLMEPLYRDIAAAIRSSQPTGPITLLASPNTSTGVGYYGRFATVGTLYWENTAGLKAAAAIYGAESDATARELLRARGVTHLALVSNGNFETEFFRLLRPNAPIAELEQTFAHRLLGPGDLPRWLKPLPYRPPVTIQLPGLSVLLLQVVPEQAEFEALWQQACAQIAMGAVEQGGARFQRAIALAAPDQRARLYRAAADFAGAQAALGPAIGFYRTALTMNPDPRAAAELAWLLATTGDAALRNGREALNLAQAAAAVAGNDLIVLNALAGALAENQRFAEAAEVANRAIGLARATGDARVADMLQVRLAHYRAGRPWRQ